MKTYELIQDEFQGELLKATQGEKILWIPPDPRNSDYQEYLRYTEWVEAGNTPEDFWSQSEDFLDTSVSEVSEPKEEEETTEGES